MKKVLLAALMAGVASSAMAADLPTRKAPPAPQVYARRRCSAGRVSMSA